MVVKPAADADAINAMEKRNMKLKYVIPAVLLFAVSLNAQETADTGYQKKVLESAEVDILMSYYGQDGVHSAVAGGEGTEELTDFTSSIVISLPMNDNDVLTLDIGISAYTSASSSNINPFDRSGVYRANEDKDKQMGEKIPDTGGANPWFASSGASMSDVLVYGQGDYSHSSEDRNTIVSGNIGFSSEYDYFSIGIGGSYTKLFNEKNTEIGVKGQIYFDKWQSIYPTELKAYEENGLNDDLFQAIPITGNPDYKPTNFELYSDEHRNSYSMSFSFSQILNKSIQASLFFDVVLQEGLLATPYHRIYFADKEDSFMEEFQLADDNENLPSNRFKLPIGARMNFYISEKFVVRSYYRYYFDDWGITSHTASLELPIKIGSKFMVAPLYRYYIQTESDYFAPKEVHLSTEKYYTSDYDLSSFNANQYGMAFRYTDIFTKTKIWKFGLKNVELRYNHYQRSDDLNADIISLGFKFVD